MADDAGSAQPKLPSDLLRRSQEAAVAKAEADAETAAADARKARTDADASALTAAQARLSSLVPNVAGANLNTLNDKTTDVAFSGVVTYAALANAGATVAARVVHKIGKLTADGSRRVLVTAQSDLLSSDLTYQLILDALNDVSAFARETLNKTALDPAGNPPQTGQPSAGATPAAEEAVDTEENPPPSAFRAKLWASALAAPAAAAVAAIASPVAPLALAVGGAVASALPSLISLLSTTTTITDHTEDANDLAAASAVIAGLNEHDDVVVNHDDFRLVPQPPGDGKSVLTVRLHALARRRSELVVRTMELEEKQNAANLQISQTTTRWDAETKKADDAKTAEPPAPAELAVADELSANYAAALELLNAALSNIDTFTTASQACASGAKPPIAVALLGEALRLGWYDYVLLVKSLGGQSQEAMQDHHFRADSYTVLANASVNYMLMDVKIHTIVAAGVITGFGAARGEVGQLPTIRVAPMASASVADPGSSGSPEEQHTHHWWPPHLPRQD